MSGCDAVSDRCPVEDNMPLASGEPLGSEDQPPDIMEYLPLVRSIAGRIYSAIPPYAAVELSDLMQAGHLGLLHARRSYRSSTNVPFAVYARFRIRGEILDSLRQIDAASRSLRRFERRVRDTRQELTAQLQREPTEDELSRKLNIDSRTFAGKRNALRATSSPVMLTETQLQEDHLANCTAPDASPETLRAESEARDLLDRALHKLPARSREMIHLYYRNGWTMREIGERFQVNESRISQIHRTALQRMARHLKAQGVAAAYQL